MHVLVINFSSAPLSPAMTRLLYCAAEPLVLESYQTKREQIGSTALVHGPQAGRSYKRREHVCGVKVEQKHGVKHGKGTLRMAT